MSGPLGPLFVFQVPGGGEGGGGSVEVRRMRGRHVGHRKLKKKMGKKMKKMYVPF